MRSVISSIARCPSSRSAARGQQTAPAPGARWSAPTSPGRSRPESLHQGLPATSWSTTPPGCRSSRCAPPSSPHGSAARFRAIRTLRLTLGRPEARPRTRSAPTLPARAPDADDAREIDATVASIRDPEVRAAARRLLGTARRRGSSTRCRVTRLRVSGRWCSDLASLAAGCASTTDSCGSGLRERPTRRGVGRAAEPAAEAYYYYSVAQYHAQGGRFKEAVAAMEEALKRDPRSAFLWRELAQWLARADSPDRGGDRGPARGRAGARRPAAHLGARRAVAGAEEVSRRPRPSSRRSSR